MRRFTPQIENEAADVTATITAEQPLSDIMDIDQYRKIFPGEIEQIAEVRVGMKKFWILPLAHQIGKTLDKIFFVISGIQKIFGSDRIFQFACDKEIISAASAAGVIAGTPLETYTGYHYDFRNGYASILDENYEEIECFHQYGGSYEVKYRDGSDPLVDWVVNNERVVDIGASDYLPLANPTTIIMDAYNHYLLTYTEENSNNAVATYFEDIDEDIFEARL